MIPLTVQMVIMSHLSDIQEAVTLKGQAEVIKDRADFCKYLLMKYPNTSEELIDADKEYKAYQDMKTAPCYRVEHFNSGEHVADINMLQRNKALEEGLITYAGKKRYLVLEENVKEFKKTIGI